MIAAALLAAAALHAGDARTESAAHGAVKSVLADPGTAFTFARDLALAGPRPAGSAAERRAHAEVEARFRAAGLRIGHDRFRVPGLGRSRNVLGIRDVPGDCLVVVMAHTDSDPPAPGADDNASGVGTLVALADALKTPTCDTWLVATGAEERGHTGQADHLGARALTRRITRTGRGGDLRFGLSLDEVGRGRSFHLRSPAQAPRTGVERRLLRVARTAKVPVRWIRDEGTGNSDHRELALTGLPAMKLGVPEDPLRHTAADTAGRLQRGAFARVLRVVGPLVTE